jgi:hypothetical protein
MSLNFLGIGAQKSGTTWLYETLSRHPKIAFPGGKEVHYWDNPQAHNVSWYLNLFKNDSLVNGDITPAYGILASDSIQQIHELLPDLRLIYLIRDPIERAWSSAKMALSRAEMTTNEASDRWFMDHFMSKGSLARGNYESCIRQWRSVYPTAQLLIVRLESIKTDPVQAANAIMAHLGLEHFFTQSDALTLGSKVFEGDGEAIRPSLVPFLQNIYQSQIDSLDRYLKNEL